MSLREIALLRLRTDGRLSAGSRPQHVIAAEQLASPVAKQVQRILDQHLHAPGARCLAPSINHPVLP